LHIPCGLLRPDGSPKPAAEVLRRLITEEWTSAGSAEADATSAIAVRGFAGDYRIETEIQGRTYSGTLSLSKTAEAAPTMTLVYQDNA
jgi:hypothetical protein